jgi:uncharacterized integral membrane protein
MQIVRTIVWVLVTIILVAFIAINWEQVPVNFWPLEDGTYLHFNWPVGFVAIVFFLLGLLPMWLLHKGTKWRFNRRISALENSVRSATVSTPSAFTTSTQLDAAAADPQSPSL